MPLFLLTLLLAFWGHAEFIRIPFYPIVFPIIKGGMRTRSMAQWLESLPGMLTALSSIPSNGEGGRVEEEAVEEEKGGEDRRLEQFRPFLPGTFSSSHCFHSC